MAVCNNNKTACRDLGRSSGPPQYASASPLVCSVCGALSAVSSLPASVLWVQVVYFTCALVDQLAGAPVLCSAETAHALFRLGLTYAWMVWLLWQCSRTLSPWAVFSREHFPAGAEGEALLKQLTSFRAPEDARLRHLWAATCMQHLGQLLVMLLESVLHPSGACLESSIGNDFALAFQFAALWILLQHARSWAVGSAAYPFLATLWRKSSLRTGLLYTVFIFMACIVVNISTFIGLAIFGSCAAEDATMGINEAGVPVPEPGAH